MTLQAVLHLVLVLLLVVRRLVLVLGVRRLLLLLAKLSFYPLHPQLVSANPVLCLIQRAAQALMEPIPRTILRAVGLATDRILRGNAAVQHRNRSAMGAATYARNYSIDWSDQSML